MYFLAEEIRELMAELGFRSMREMLGRTDCLEFQPALDHWKAAGVDLSNVLFQPKVPAYVGKQCEKEQDHELDASLDRTQLLRLCEPALENRFPVTATLPIRNTDRVVGTIVGSEVTRRFGSEGLPDSTINLLFKGSAGQSFGAFIPPGMTLSLEGDANDYIGKGLSGGRIVVYSPRRASFVPEENVIIGNVAFYGATGGEVFISGVAGERFCVRNSGVNAVVEGVGDHGCEYMTGGRVVVLGETGRNFAAGMSGGIAYVLDTDSEFAKHCNLEMVQLFELEDDDEAELVRGLIQKHVNYTGSKVAWRLLDQWEDSRNLLVKVYPNDFRRVMEAQEQVRAEGMSEDEILMAAFEKNVEDELRAGGN
jgi:glutamate synthase (ferredoxin)